LAGPHVAAEGKLFEGDERTARRIGKGDAAVSDDEMVDRHGFGIEADRRRQPVEPPGLVETEGEFGPFHRHIGGAKLAAHQRIEGELDLQGARPRPHRLARPADLDGLQFDRGRRQNMHLDRAGDPHLQAGEARGLRLEGVAEASPIDKQRTDQCRHQHQDDCNRSSEQRRLHAVATAKVLRVRPPGCRRLCPKGPMAHFSTKRGICLWGCVPRSAAGGAVSCLRRSRARLGGAEVNAPCFQPFGGHGDEMAIRALLDG